MNRRHFLATSAVATAAFFTRPLPSADSLDRLANVLSFSIPEAEAHARRQRPRRSVEQRIDDAYDATRRNRGEADLETQISYFIGNLRGYGVIPASERTSFYVYDLEKRFSAADINIDVPHMAASLIKVYVMAAAYAKFERENIANGRKQEVLQDIRAMIQQSDNAATNRVIRFVGGVRAAQRSIDGMHLFRQTRIVEEIPQGGRTYRNMTSAHDLSIFMNQLHQEHLVSPAASREMLGILDGYHTSRVERVLLPLQSVDDLAGKTGTVYGMNGETTIVSYANKADQSRPFVFTAMFEDRSLPHSGHHDGSWARRRSEMIRKVAQLTVAYYQSEKVERYRDLDQQQARVRAMQSFYRQRQDFVQHARQRGREYLHTIREAAREQNLDWHDLYAVLFVESGFQTDAVSPTGPVGIAQLTVDAARDAGLRVDDAVDERRDARKAIDAAARILHGHIDYFRERYNANPELARDNAIAAYQLGRTGVSNLLDGEKESSYWHLDTNSPENREYVPRVHATKSVVFRH